MIIKNGESEITSNPTGAIIEPFRENLESNSLLYPIKFLVFKGNTLNDKEK